MTDNSVDVMLVPRVFVHLVPANRKALAHMIVWGVLRKILIDFEVRAKFFDRGCGRPQ
jgi:F420-0:gamma-glutamyl ligase-like protein